MMEPKDSIVDVESVPITPSTTIVRSSQASQKHDLPEAEQRRILRRIDVRVSVVLGAINCISLMDRSNLGMAAVAGMSKDLELGVGNRYNFVALIFFLPYVIFEFSSTVLARKTRTRPFLMTICILWGFLMIGTGFVNHWTQLAGLRALLGFLESAYFPTVMFLLSSWYTRYEVQKRFALFFSITVAISSLGGIMVYGFMQMNGFAGLGGWRWIFIMEGILTVLGGIVAGFFIVDFPDKARNSFKFLTNAQIDWVLHRLREDRGDVDDEPFSWAKFFRAGLEFPVWLFAMIYCCCGTVAYCVSFFLPLIIHKEMGFDAGTAICLSTPPYLFSGLVMYGTAWTADRYRIRGPILLINSAVAIVGLVLLGWTKPSSVRYFSLFVINGGILGNIPTAMAYSTNNVQGQWRRAFSSATFVVGGGLGGVFGALIFGDGSPSALKRGLRGCIAANVVVVVIVLGLTLHFRHQNNLARQGRKVIYGHPGFLYAL